MPAWGSARRVKPFHGNVADGTDAPHAAALSVQRAPRLGARAGARARRTAHAPTPADIVSDPPAPPGALATRCCVSASSPSPEGRAAKAHALGAGARVLIAGTHGAPSTLGAAASLRRTRTTHGQDKARRSSQVAHRNPTRYSFFAGSPGSSSSSLAAQRDTLSMALALASTASSAPGPEGEILNDVASVARRTGAWSQRERTLRFGRPCTEPASCNAPEHREDEVHKQGQ